MHCPVGQFDKQILIKFGIEHILFTKLTKIFSNFAQELKLSHLSQNLK